ncbi:hypothetical protein GCM10009535_11190 [Streptomyces thermocarboxydovorans]|uniref:Uncharacterized protein n=1 Tax=Streptomyces thermocarboxydovorans TaxID=59298 RepID=A0ABP3SFI1_9ACTN
MKNPNEDLERWLARSGMSRKELARRVKAAAQTWGQAHITPDATTVRRMQPYGKHRLVADFNERARELVAAA